MKSQIRVTIITITYNCASSLQGTIASVLSQDYDNIEYIIIDGKSTDGTWEKIQSYEPELKARFKDGFFAQSEKDGGISDAFNKGIARASGDIILLLNAGDFFLSESAAGEAARDFELFEKPGVLYYKVRIGEKSFMPGESTEEADERVWKSCQVPHQGAFVSKETYEKIGGYDTNFKIRMDFDFFARCYRGGVTHKFVPKPIASYEIGGTSMQLQNAKRFYSEGLSIIKKYALSATLLDRIQPYIPNCVRRAARLFIKR